MKLDRTNSAYIVYSRIYVVIKSTILPFAVGLPGLLPLGQRSPFALVHDLKRVGLDYAISSQRFLLLRNPAL